MHPTVRRRLALLGCAALLTACQADVPLAGPTAAPRVGPSADPNALDGPTQAPSEPAPLPTTSAPPRPSEPDGSAAGGGGAACQDPLGCYGEPERVGTFDVDAISEASGLAASHRTPGVLYLLDDAEGTSSLLLVRTDGTTIGEVEVEGMDLRDGESLAIGPCEEGSAQTCVYIGDIGDNRRSRNDVVVHRVAEPDLADGPPSGPLTSERIRLRYPDGAHDAEALLVDGVGRPHIVTKAPFDRASGTTGDARLYRAGASTDGMLEALGTLPVPEPAAPLQSALVGNVVTGGEHRDGRVLLRTYDQVLEYVGPEGASGADLSGLPTWTVRAVPAPAEPQSEAITWAADGCGYLTAGEMVGDLWFVPCRS